MFENEKKDFETISVLRSAIPKGAKLVEAYETEKEIIICGEPEENDESHNCDQMGCSSVSHVLYRFKKIEDTKFSDKIMMTRKELCRKHSLQCCDDCNDVNCCDNINPLVIELKRMKKLCDIITKGIEILNTGIISRQQTVSMEDLQKIKDLFLKA